jgi:hypothetical protein
MTRMTLEPISAAPWHEIKAGHTVLACEDPDEGWWPSVVIAVDGDLLTLAWRDYKDYPTFTAHRTGVGLLHPR